MPRVGTLLLRPQAWREGGKGGDGQRHAHHPLAEARHLAGLVVDAAGQGWPLTSRSRAMPLYSIGSSLGFCTRSLTMKRISMPCPGEVPGRLGRYATDRAGRRCCRRSTGRPGTRPAAGGRGSQAGAWVLLLGSNVRPWCHSRFRFAAQPIRLRQWTKDMPMPARVLRGLVAALPCSSPPARTPPVQRGDRPLCSPSAASTKPACASSTLFKTFPVTLSDSFSGPGPAKGNAAVYDALVGVGLLRRDGDFLRPHARRPRGTTSPSRRPSATAAASTSASVRWTPPSPTTTARPWKRAGWSPSRSSHAK